MQQLALVLAGVSAPSAQAQLAIRGEIIHTMAGQPIRDGLILVREGRIESVGKIGETKIPEGYRVLVSRVVTPGLIDAHSVVGLSGILNQPHDQEQLEKSGPIH
jgi:imidazolonepropionase-like amidohydrolase